MQQTLHLTNLQNTDFHHKEGIIQTNVNNKKTFLNKQHEVVSHGKKPLVSEIDQSLRHT